MCGWVRETDKVKEEGEEGKERRSTERVADGACNRYVLQVSICYRDQFRVDGQ